MQNAAEDTSMEIVLSRDDYELLQVGIVLTFSFLTLLYIFIIIAKWCWW